MTSASTPPRAPATPRHRLRVAVLAPMPSELRPLIALLGLKHSDAAAPALLQGSVGRVEIVAALTGVGPSAGATCAARVLDATTVDHVVVVGIAGDIGPSVAVGDLVVPETVCDLDTGATLLPRPIGDVRPRGVLASSAALVEDPGAARRLEERGVIAIDMETAAIGSVCEARGRPWSVFRAVSDRADDGGTDRAVFDLIDADGRPDLGAVARFVLTRPGRIPLLVRLARGSHGATRRAAAAAAAAIERL